MADSVLVNNMQAEASRMEEFPVLIGDEIAYFHDVRGNYDRRSGRHHVALIHERQGVGRPNHIRPSQASHDVEAHLENYYSMDCVGVSTNIEDYPDDDYEFEVTVTNYRQGPQSFSEALTADIDKRETRFEI